MSLTIANTINVINTTLSSVNFFDLNFVNGLTSNETYYLDTPTLYTSFKSLPPFDIKFDILAKQFKLSGRLVYEYNPFHNLILANPTSLTQDQQTFYFQTGDICDFNISGSLLPLDLNHPLEIEIQPSYDGSVNIIALDNLNQAILVNSRFSPEELDTYRIIDRRGSNDTNLYEEAYLQSQTKLYKTSNVISQLVLDNIETGGKMLAGSYIFYFKYADLDGNETDIIAESGIISCYIGNVLDPKSIRGGILNEVTDKLIKLKIKHLDKAYDYITIYYVRTTSDYSEVLAQSLYKVLETYAIKSSTIVDDEMILTISGYESVLEITTDELLQTYNIVDRQKSIAQIQNRLFQANLTQDTSEYKELEDLALRFFPTIRLKQNIGNLNLDYEVNPLFPGLEYYDPKNIHDYLGYWNKEIYRTGIVFIYSDNRLSPVFNTRGGQNLGELNLDSLLQGLLGLLDYKNKIQTGGNLENSKTCYSFFELYDGDKRNYINVTENKDIINPTGNKINENGAGVFNIMHLKGPITQLGVIPLSIQFSTTKDVLEYLYGLGIKGFFFVRQKRIPTILFQGITQGLSTELCLPLLFTQNYAQSPAHRIEYISYVEPLASNSPTIYTAAVKIDGQSGEATRISFESGDPLNTLSNGKTAFDKRFALLKTGHYKQSGCIYSPDVMLNTELMSDLLVGNDVVYSKCFHKLINNALKQSYTYEPSTSVTIPSRHFYADGISNEVNKTLFSLKATLVEDGHPLKFSGTQRFRGLAGIQEEVFRFEATESITIDSGLEVPNPDYAIRGIYSTYVGLEHAEFLPSGTLIDVHIPSYSYENMSKYFLVRKSSFQSYYAITNKFSLENILKDLSNNNQQVWHIELYRGDCFVGNYTQRINRNFQDAELPLNDTILGNMINAETNSSMYNLSVWFSLGNNVVNRTGIPFVEDNYQLVNRLDVNAVQLGHWLTFKTCSNHNICYRTIDKQYPDEYALTGTYRTFFPFSKISWTSESKIAESQVINKGYSTTLPIKSHFINPEVPFIQDKFNNRIMFSEIHVNDSFKNGYRIFKGLNYKDYNVGYGSITKILEWKNNILVVFEHGIGIIPVNENLLLADGNNTGNVYIRGVDVLPKAINTISDTYGSQWKDSIIKSGRYVYGIDHVAKKMWRTDGEAIELISDFKIQSFLNENITLNSREKTPTIGIRNIKTHYNAFKEDIMFTYYDVDSVIDEKKWNICYNEQLSRWITRYDWEPLASLNINNIYFSYDRESPENLLFLSSSYYSSKNSNGITVTNYEILDPNNPDNVDYVEAGTNSILLEYRPLLLLKSHVLEKYYPDYFIDSNDGYDNQYFKIVTTTIVNPNNPFVPLTKKEIAIKSLPEGLVTIEQLVLLEKFLFSIRVKAIMYKQNGAVWDTVWDTIHLRLDRSFYDDTDATIDENGLTQRDRYDRAYMTRFWKHGQAGSFDYVGEIKPTTWYARTRPFEFEFIMLDQPSLHKVLNNLLIISNRVAPESFEFTVTTDSYTLLELPYDIAPTLEQYVLNRRGLDTSLTDADDYILTTVTNETIKLNQKAFDTWKVGRLFGNMHYKEDFWYVDVLPIQIYQKNNALPTKGSQSKIKDKLIRIRVKYDGKDLAVITLLNSLYSQTYA